MSIFLDNRLDVRQDTIHRIYLILSHFKEHPTTMESSSQLVLQMLKLLDVHLNVACRM